ncbi:N12 class adenine-specific DNA methylase [Novosphingobium sp. PhB55]|uniref:PLxRFG domain-containing protein n=1 Tax=Novosphingobium sp. PhB55 TaxID=2485106 RepID=UPI0010671910|nr:PLxRFG domain-containing protein [Novosphingobium sp. PhB55]TDW63089.1 N12 class adenine-specific DNA methylase [Novosphingobium sp. PhB55]
MAKSIFSQNPYDVALGEIEAEQPPVIAAAQIPQLKAPPAPRYQAPTAPGGSSGGGGKVNAHVNIPAKFTPMFEAASRKYNVPVNILMALAEQESHYNPGSIGTPTQWGTAKGIMQYLDSTAAGMGINPYNPAQAIDAAAKQLKQRLDKGYSMRDAVMEHHAGPDRKLWGPKTRTYGTEVLGRAARLKGELAPEYAKRNATAPGSDAFERIMSVPLPKSVEEQRAREDAANGRAPAAGKKGDYFGAGNPVVDFAYDAEQLWESGVVGAGDALAWLVDKIPGVGKHITAAVDAADRYTHGGKGSKQLSDEHKAQTERSLTPAMQTARKKAWVVEPGDDLGNGEKAKSWALGPAWGDPRSYASGIVESLPETIVSMGPARKIATGTFEFLMSRGATRAIASKWAARAATVAGGLTEGLFGGAHSAMSVRDEILAMKPEDLAQSDAYKVLLQQGMKPDEARRALAEDTSLQAFVLAGTATAAFGGMGDRALFKIFSGEFKSRIGATLGGAVGEGLLEELPQSALSKMAENKAMQTVDPDRPLTRGAANEALGGLAAGGLMGAGFGIAGHGGHHGAETDEHAAADPAAPAAPAADSDGPATPTPPPSGPLGRAMARAPQPVAPAGSGAVPVPAPEGVAAKKLDLVVGNSSHPVELVGETDDAVWVKNASGEELAIPHAELAPGGSVRLVDPATGSEHARVAQPGQPAAAPATSEPNSAADLQEGFKAIGGAMAASLIDMYHQRAAAGDVKDAAGAASPILQVAKRVRQRLGGAELDRAQIEAIARDVDAVNSTGAERQADLRAIVTKHAPEVIHPQTGEVLSEEAPAAPVETPAPKPAPKPAPAPITDGASLVGKSQAELRDRLKTLSSQARSGNGWTKAMLAEKKRVSAAIDALTAQPVAETANSEIPQLLPESTNSEPAPVAIADMPSGKSIVVRGVAQDEEARVRAALPDKALPQWSEKDGGWIVSKKHEAKLREALIPPTSAPAEVSPAAPAAEEPGRPTLAQAEAEAATSPHNDRPEPTDAQKEAGNYKKGHVAIGGLDVSIENPAGTSRRPEWPPLKHTYGYVKGSEGADGDHVDVFLGPKAEDVSKPVYIVDQVNEDDTFDEHKVMVGFDSEEDARAGYLANYEKGWTGLGDITPMPFDQFQSWVKDAEATAKPAGKIDKPAGKKAKTAPEHVHNVGKPLDPENRFEPVADISKTKRTEDLADIDPAAIVDLTMPVDDFKEVTDEWASLFAHPEKVAQADKRALEEGRISLDEAHARIEGWKEHVRLQGEEHRQANSDKTILSLFDYTGEWSRPYEEAGYNVIRFDIQHGQDVMDFSVEWFNDNYDFGEVYGILAACPCTDFASSGARHFAGKDADGRTEASKELVFQTLRTIEYFRPKFWVLENPVGRIERLTGLPRARMTFNPSSFGAPYTKKTMLWGKFNGELPLAPVEPTEGSKMHRLYGGKSQATKNARSETPEGFAYAFFMANNFGDADPVERTADDFPEASGAVRSAFKAGMSEDEIRAVLERPYGDYEYDEARSALLKAVAAKGGNKAKPRDRSVAIIMDPGAGTVKAVPVGPQKAEAAAAQASPPSARKPDAKNPNPYVRNGDKARFAEKVGYLGGDPADTYIVESVGKKQAFFKNDRTGGSSSLQNWEMKRALAAGHLTVEPRTEVAPKAKKPAQAEPTPAETAQADRFAGNKLFTADKVEAARARLRAKMSQLNSGVDPEVLIDGMTIAGAYIEAGVRSFAEFAGAMRSDFGKKITPYLLSFWEGARNYPGLDNKGMTSPAEAAQQHAQLVAEGLPAEERHALGTEVAAPKAKAKPEKAGGARILRSDWPADHIDGWTPIEGGANQPTDYGLKGGLKDAFLSDAVAYLRATASTLAGLGFEAHAGAKGKAGNPVSRNDAGPAVSGDVFLTMTHPVTGANVYVTVGASAMRGAVPTNRAGVSLMYRVSNKAGDKYGTGSVNRWAPIDLTAADLSELIAKEAGGRAQELARDHVPAPHESGRSINRGRVSSVQSGGRQRDDTAARPDLGELGTRQSEDVGESSSLGTDGEDGVRGAGAHVAPEARAGEARISGDGRSGDRGARGAIHGGRDVGGREQRSAGRTAGSFPVYSGSLAADDETSRDASGLDLFSGHDEKPQADKPRVDPAQIAPALPADPSPTRAGSGNFHLANPLEIVGGGPVARFDRNRKALEVYNEIRDAGRAATAEEQRTLAGYLGWGSFGQELFQGTWDRPMHKDGWDERGKWLRDHMGKEEWESAQRSITNAHYIDPPTVMAMWAMMQRMGFKGGRVLEPSMGIGNFFGMMPAELAGRSQLAGIEMDSLTGGMAQLLYPDANIRVMPYQKSQTPDGFYDLTIGNWPFENTVIADRRYDRLSPLLHDYFFLKTLDQVRAGGIVMGITSSGSMDKKATGIRRELAKKAELVAAFRLPSGAFAEYAGTNVVTDIIILKKRAEPSSLADGAGWINSVPHVTPGGEVSINEYFAANPSHVIGTIDFGSGTTRGRPGMIVHRPADMAEHLKRVIDAVPQGIYTADAQAKHISFVANHTADREGALTSTKDGLFVVRGEHLAPAAQVRAFTVKDAKKNEQRVDQLERLVDMRQKYAALIEAERAGDATAARKALASAYSSFTKDHGKLADSFGLGYLEKIDDPFYPALAALEIDGKPATILSRSTTRGAPSIENPSIAEAFVLERNASVNPSVAAIAERANKPAAEVKAELIDSGAVFELPNGDVIPSDMYLSGNVREKLRQAKAAVAEGMEHLARNVAALEKVVPADVPYFKIETQLGATWVSPETYGQFVVEMLGLPDAKGVEVRYNDGRWTVRIEDRAKNRPEARTGYGTGEYPFQRLVNAAFSNQSVTIRRRDSEGNQYVDNAATEEVNGKIAEMRTKFGEWLWSDPERRVAVEAEYNETRNAFATPKFDGSFLRFEGMALSLGNGPFDLRQHQADAIWRALVSRRSLNAHEVGTGKTFTMGGIAVESRRYGIAKKPLIFAHNANSKSVAAEIQMMYPAAKLLYIDNLTPQTIDVKMRQIANDDWDAIVVPHSLIDRFSFQEETLMAMAREEIAALEEEAYLAADEDGATIDKDMWDDPEALKRLRSPTAKELVKMRQRIIETIRKQSNRSSREGAISFEELGVDMLMVDEAHEFKKPPISTRMKMKGLNTQTSDRSIALSFLTRYVRANNAGGNVHLFTGTPVTNTLTEVFHMMRYIMQEEMQAAGVDQWDGWFGSFAREVMDVEQNAAAEYEAVTRLAGFINVPELRRMIGQYMDVVFAEDMPEMQPRRTASGKTMADELTEAERAELLNGRTEGAKDRPYKKVINVTSDLTPQQKVIFEELRGYARRWRQMTGKERKDAMAAGSPESPIITEGLAAKASFDVRLYDGEALAGREGQAFDDEGSKASRIVANVKEIYESHPLATQVIFAEQGFSTRVTRSMGRNDDGKKVTRSIPSFSTIRDIVARLEAAGIPREQIALVDGSTSKDRRKEIASAMNAAKIRVVIGSTATLGVGVNMQKNLRAMHHMDAPWMPGDLEQRNGRGQRQANQWNTVLEYRYLTDRLDGRRWQVLAIKQRFITAFLKADDSARVIEGEAASDEQSDILTSFAEAAGDPRILIREKLRKQLEGAQRRERLYTQGIANALRQARSIGNVIGETQAELGEIDKRGTVETIGKLISDNAGKSFSIDVQGKTIDSRKDADEAIQEWAAFNLRVGDEPQRIGSFGGHDLLAGWPSREERPVLRMVIDGKPFNGATVQGLETSLRKFAADIERKRTGIADMEATMRRLKAVADEPFHMAGDLERYEKALGDLEDDIAANPVPPPAWLRAGAPIDTGVFWKGKEFTVTGHRWTDDGWFVVAQDERGSLTIPYQEAKDAQGINLYEARDFETPELVKPGKEDTAQGTPEDEPAAHSIGTPSGGGFTSAKGLRQHLEESRLGKAIAKLIDAGKIVLHDTAATLPGNVGKTIGRYSLRNDPLARAFLTGPVVASMKGDEVPVGNAGELRRWAAGYFADKTGSVVEHPELGEIKLDGRAAKDSLGHGFGAAKAQGLFLLPDALRQARVLAEESRQDGQSGFVLAAPVDIDGRHHVLTMVVKRTDNRTGLYVHEVRVTEEVVRDAAIITAVPAEAGQSRGSSRTVTNILREVFRVNEAAGDDAPGNQSPRKSTTQLETPPINSVQGMTTADGTIHLVADKLTSRTALPVLLHEMFHSGVRGLIGDTAWRSTLDRLGVMYRAAAGREGSGERANAPFWAKALRRVEAAQPLPGQEVEEFAAYAVENQALAPAGVRALVDRLIGAVKAWALRRFGRQLGQISPAQLEALAIAALRSGSNTARAAGASSIDTGPAGVPESVADAMLALAENDDLFSYPRSDATTIEQAMTDLMPGVRVIGSFTDIDEVAGGPFEDMWEEHKPDRMSVFETESGKRFYAFERNDRVWIDVSRFTQGDYGSRVYMATAEYALNAGKVFIGDPAGLSDNALIRRTDMMLSIALKHRTTDHIAPHPRQLEGDKSLKVPPLAWRDGDFYANVRALIGASLESLAPYVPLIESARYDVGSRAFRTRSGKPLADDAVARAAGNARSAGRSSTGSRTVKRALLLNSLLREEGGEATRLLERAVFGGPESVFSPAVEDTFYSRVIPSEEDVDLATPGLIHSLVTKAMDSKASVLSVVPLRPLLSEMGAGLPAAQEYLQHKQAMDAHRDKWHARADQTAQPWLKFRVLHKAENVKLMDLMHEATLANVDPAKPFVSSLTELDRKILAQGSDTPGYDVAAKKLAGDKIREQDHQRLGVKWDALPAQAKRIYNEVRDTYTALGLEFEQTLLDNLSKALDIKLKQAYRKYNVEMDRLSKSDLTFAAAQKRLEQAGAELDEAKKLHGWTKGARMSRLRALFETNKLQGPYFPLSRFGNFFVTAKNADDEVVTFSRFESPREQADFAKEMRSAGHNVEIGVLDDGGALRAQVDPRFVAAVEGILEDSDAPESVRDSVWQLWLETMPDMSVRTNRIHRKGRAGFNKDALRAFGNHMFHGSHQLARLKYALDMDEALAVARDQAKTLPDPVRAGLLVNEMGRRHQFIMNPTGGAIAQGVTSAAFVYYLSTSPAAAIVNTAQTAIMGVPILAAYHGKAGAGAARASAELAKALKDFASGKGHVAKGGTLTADERDAIEEAYETGLIERTQSHDLAGVGETGVKYSPVRAKMMGAISWAFHHTERMNREVTFLAAYRMARKKGEGRETAIDTAARLTWKIHFDYQNTSRPRVMQSDTAKVLFVFRNFQANMLWRLFRDAHQSVKGASPKARKEAITQLAGTTGMMMLSAGVRGTWLYGIAIMLAGLLFGDDAEDKFKKGMIDALGRRLGGMALNGVPGDLLGIDLSNRIGMPDLWFRSPDREMEGAAEFDYWAMQNLGAGVGMLRNGWLGASQIKEGHTERGIETMAPKFAKDLMRAARYITEGATTITGDPIMEEMSPMAALKQALGFTPAELAERYERNRSMKNHEQRILDDRKSIMADYDEAQRADEDTSAIEERLERFNEENPDYPITPRGMMQSMRSRAKMRDRKIGGVSLNPKLSERLNEEAPPLIYGQ